MSGWPALATAPRGQRALAWYHPPVAAFGAILPPLPAGILL